MARHVYIVGCGERHEGISISAVFETLDAAQDYAYRTFGAVPRQVDRGVPIWVEEISVDRVVIERHPVRRGARRG